MIRRPPRSTLSSSSAASDVYKRQVLVGGIFAGLGVALVLSQLRPVVITVDQLRSHFDMPVLGNVSRTISEQEHRQRSVELLGFAGGTLLLMLIFVAFLAFDIFGGLSAT
eukprot:TRINITY_DN19691_c0_g1_i5.p1 TRINITY_DN19691_c0_g1~~TRINITY_DN19691_c0_g1_i5.p1  ORF type:complete len:110 (+),score=8.67 TRINITY_DN19691_c0_g1_i5:99-428(+)